MHPGPCLRPVSHDCLSGQGGTYCHTFTGATGAITVRVHHYAHDAPGEGAYALLGRPLPQVLFCHIFSRAVIIGASLSKLFILTPDLTDV